MMAAAAIVLTPLQQQMLGLVLILSWQDLRQRDSNGTLGF